MWLLGTEERHMQIRALVARSLREDAAEAAADAVKAKNYAGPCRRSHMRSMKNYGSA